VRRLLGLSLALLCLAGCAARRHPVASADDGPRPGTRVDYEALPDPNARLPALSEKQVFMAAVPLDAPLPAYPGAALSPDAAPVQVVLRVVIDETGVVRDVADSPLDVPAPDTDRTAFREAAAGVLRDWRFLPAVIRTLTDGSDVDHDGKPDYTVVSGEERVRSYLDLRFTFEVVDGHGRVKIG
jgi:hypothetical protein